MEPLEKRFSSMLEVYALFCLARNLKTETKFLSLAENLLYLLREPALNSEYISHQKLVFFRFQLSENFSIFSIFAKWMSSYDIIDLRPKIISEENFYEKSPDT